MDTYDYREKVGYVNETQTKIGTLTNSNGFDITESYKFMRTRLDSARCIGVDSKDNEISLTLIFDCSNLLDSI